MVQFLSAETCPSAFGPFHTLEYLQLLGNFGILLLEILYLRKVVGRICELCPLYLCVQVLTRNIPSGLGIVRKFGDLVVRNFVT